MGATLPNLPRRILIVDDDKSILDAFALAFEDKGYAVAIAWDRASFEAALHTGPDLILMDILMADMNGIDESFHLKLKKATQNIPIILMTAARLTGLDRVRAAYAHSILLKPLDLDAVDSLIDRFLPPDSMGLGSGESSFSGTP